MLASSLLTAPAASLKGVPVDTSTLAFHPPPTACPPAPTQTHSWLQTHLPIENPTSLELDGALMVCLLTALGSAINSCRFNVC